MLNRCVLSGQEYVLQPVPNEETEHTKLRYLLLVCAVNPPRVNFKRAGVINNSDFRSRSARYLQF